MQQQNLFQPQSLTVTDLTRYVRALLEGDELLKDVWVSGEISNFTRAASGHMYFTLKDSGSALKCVIWKTSAARMRYPLQNGLAVEAHGAIGVFERDGIYQLYVDAVRPAGEGRLYMEFLRLKARLEAEGVFDEDRKRPLPAFPRRIGIVTSPTGAALQDMLNTLRRRFPLAEVILSPSAVQGEAAPLELVRALAALVACSPPPDVILLARGGGSLEDLWAFNDERVVRAVAASAVPVVSGVGHETDFTLVDFAADVRAPTPTGAAALATPDSSDLKMALERLVRRLEPSARQPLLLRQSLFASLQARLERISPRQQIMNERQRVDMALERAHALAFHRFELERAAVQRQDSRLDALNPLNVLRRGFAAVFQADGIPITSLGQVVSGQAVRVRLADGRFAAQVTGVDTSPIGNQS